MEGNSLSERELRSLSVGQFGAFPVYNLTFASVRDLRGFLAGAPEMKEVLRRSEDASKEELESFLNLAKCLQMVNLKASRSNVAEPAFVGNRPNVPAYVAGAPKNMYRIARAKEKKVVQVLINLTYAGNTTAAQIRNRGILALNLVRVLEQNGYIVDFRAFEATFEDNAVCLCDVVLKKPGGKLNPESCYYPLCEQLVLRQAVGRLQKMSLRIKPEESSGRLSDEKLAELLLLNRQWKISLGNGPAANASPNKGKPGRRQIFLGTPASLGITGGDIYRDADSFLRSLKLADMITVPKYESEEE